jgi:hypothetical protein
MAKHIELKPVGRRKRKRPRVTHRDVSHLAAVERARAPQNDPGTVPHALTLGERPGRADGA